MGKHIFRSRDEAEAAYKNASRENTVYYCVLNMLLRKEAAKIFKSGPWTVRLLGADRADGGFVIVTLKTLGGTCPRSDSHVYYFEDWVRDTKTIDPAPSNREGYLLRQLAYDVEAYVQRAGLCLI